MENLCRFLLDKKIMWSNLSECQTIWEQDLITEAIFEEYLDRWNLSKLLLNPAFLTRMNTRLFELLLPRINSYWSTFSENLHLIPILTVEFLSTYESKIHWRSIQINKFPILSEELFDKYYLKLDKPSVSANLLNHPIMNSQFFIKYKNYWDYKAFNYQVFFKHPMMDREFFDAISSNLTSMWGNEKFISNLIEHKMIDSEFMETYQLELEELDIDKIPTLLSLQSINPELFNRIYSCNLVDELPIEGNWNNYSNSQEIFLHPDMNSDYIIKYIENWNLRLLCNNICFINHPMMSKNLLTQMHLKLTGYKRLELWRAFSMSKCLFSAKFMTSEIFAYIGNTWNWDLLSRNQHLFNSKLMNLEFFNTYKWKWNWKYLSNNIGLFRSHIMTGEFFKRYNLNDPHRFKCYARDPRDKDCYWHWKMFNSNHKILRIAEHLR